VSVARPGDPSQRGTPTDLGSVSCAFPLHPRSVRLARHATRYVCRFWRTAAAADAAELAVSELFGNAVKTATGSEVVLRMSWSPRRLRVEVCDASAQAPVVREAAPNDEGGRGLWLVRELAVRWGTHPQPGGKCVWAEFALPG
jgi:anti-sigma regulatory factor (Ser/Thr protein kinase)